MRASDPIYELGLALGAHRKENLFWRQTLTTLARHLGQESSSVLQHLVCVDTHRQGRRWRNHPYNAAIRSAPQALTDPFTRSGRRRKTTPV
ncbi:MAG: hypothetical protein ACYCSF_13220 [Acidimicrobiales bacterium]